MRHDCLSMNIHIYHMNFIPDWVQMDYIQPSILVLPVQCPFPYMVLFFPTYQQGLSSVLPSKAFHSRIWYCSLVYALVYSPPYTVCIELKTEHFSVSLCIADGAGGSSPGGSEVPAGGGGTGLSPPISPVRHSLWLAGPHLRWTQVGGGVAPTHQLPWLHSSLKLSSLLVGRVTFIKKYLFHKSFL